jgi:hypothetical protein
MTPPPAAAAAAAPVVRRARSAAPVRARSAAPARPLTTAPRPRRVSGPARRERPRAQPQRQARAEEGLAVGALAALRGLEGHRLLDRLIRGRTWIALLAFALIGIVTLQLVLLKLNAGIGRTLEQMASLQSANAALSIENAELAAGDRVEASAAGLGMGIVPIGSLKSLTPRPHLDAARAASALSTPVHVTSMSEASAAATTTSTSPSASTEQPAPATGASPPGEAPASITGEAGSHESQPAASEASAPTSSSGASSATPPPSGESAGSSAASEATPAGGVQAGPAG